MKAPVIYGVSGLALLGVAAPLFLSAPARAQKPSAAQEAPALGGTIIVLPPVYHRNLALYPVRLEGSAGKDYISLDEGLKSGQVEVREVGANPPPLVRPRPPQGRAGSFAPAQAGGQSQRFQQGQGVAGDVNRLQFFNRSDKKLLLLAGEMVIGGKQDRIVQKDAIVPPSDKPKIIDVFCVEHGRWGGASAQFSPAAITGGGVGGGGLGGGIADPSVRGTAQAKTEQQAVWDEVGKKNSRLGAPSGQSTYQAARTSAMNLAEEKPYLQALEGKVSGKNIAGVIVAVNGKLIWLDLFASDVLFEKYWPKLLRSYILEAVSTRPAKDIEERIRWKLPTQAEAAAYMADRAGNARFEGEEGVFKLLRIENREHVIYELTDLDRKSPLRLHTCKMEKK